MNNIFANAPLMSALLGLLIAQFLKPFVYIKLEKGFNAKLWHSTGGMPSSHTASTVALAASAGIKSGLASVDFAVATVLAVVVMYDAMGIRAAAGKQAKIINDWSKFFAEFFSQDQFSEEHLKTMLGHSFNQVLWGFVLGIAVGAFTSYILIP